METEKILAIIRINTTRGDLMESIKLDHDLWDKCLHYKARLRVPYIRTLKRVIRNDHEFIYKPLLFSYGFLEVPLEIGQRFEALALVKDLSQVIRGYVLRSPNSLYQEQLKNRGKKEPVIPILVETIKPEELVRLNDYVTSNSIYNPANSQTELSIGAMVILRGYPFQNLLAQVLSREKKYYKVVVVSTGIILTVPLENLYYSPYEESGLREVTFTELGYIPEPQNY